MRDEQDAMRLAVRFSNLKRTQVQPASDRECSCQTCTAVILCVSVVDVSVAVFLRDNNGTVEFTSVSARQLHIRGRTRRC